MSTTIRDHILGLIPLFLALIVLYFLHVDIASCALFSISYLWHLFLTFPTTSERMNNKGYRFSFVRMIYLFYQKMDDLFNKKKIFILSSFFRFLGPLFFALLFSFFYSEVNYFILFIGAFYFELCFFTQKKFLKES